MIYGKIKGRIKVPSAGGTWPAFWLMPTNSVYGGWPHSGEIDIMEHYGCDPGHVHSTVHNNTYNWNGGIPPTSYSTYTSATSDFHIYEVEWTEDELKFYGFLESSSFLKDELTFFDFLKSLPIESFEFLKS